MQIKRVVSAVYVSKRAEVRHRLSGTPVTNVQVGESIRYADVCGETRELTNFRSLSFCGALAEDAQAFKKGDNVYADGRIEQRQFIGRDGSKSRTVHEIVVSPCHLIAPVRRGNKLAESAAGKNTANGSRTAGVKNDWPVAG